MAGLGSYIDTAGVKRRNVGMVAVNTAGVATEVNGAPVQSFEDQRVLDGFGYTVSTAIVSVASGNVLYAELANPVGSGVNLILTSRVLSNNVLGGQAPLEYVRYASSAVIPASPTPTPVTVNNRISGGAASTATFRYGMGSTLPTGATTSAGFIPTNGQEKRIKDIVILAPGQKLIYAVGGAGGGLAAAARLALTFLFYAKPI